MPNHSRRMSTDGNTSGYAMGAGPFQRSARFSSMNDTPMAVIRGASRKAAQGPIGDAVDRHVDRRRGQHGRRKTAGSTITSSQPVEVVATPSSANRRAK